jgi:hypothetical protein
LKKSGGGNSTIRRIADQRKVDADEWRAAVEVLTNVGKFLTARQENSDWHAAPIAELLACVGIVQFKRPLGAALEEIGKWDQN